MKKLTFASLFILVLFMIACNDEKVDLTDIPVKRLISGTIPLEEADKAINKYRRGGGVLRLAFAQKKFGIAHDSLALEKYLQETFSQFKSQHQNAVKDGYTWTVGFAYGVCLTPDSKKPCINLYAFPVLSKSSAKDKSEQIRDYFSLKKDKHKDTIYYIADTRVGPNNRTTTTVLEEEEFVFDEGTLWP